MRKPSQKKIRRISLFVCRCFMIFFCLKSEKSQRDTHAEIIYKQKIHGKTVKHVNHEATTIEFNRIFPVSGEWSRFIQSSPFRSLSSIFVHYRNIVVGFAAGKIGMEASGLLTAGCKAPEKRRTDGSFDIRAETGRNLAVSSRAPWLPIIERYCVTRGPWLRSVRSRNTCTSKWRTGVGR